MRRHVPLLALIAVLSAANAVAAGAAAVELDVRARALAPGEPVRIVARCAESLSGLTGRFLDRDLDFQPLDDGRWAAWAVVALDRPPGIEAVEVRGRTAEGGEAVGTHAVEIEARSFPEERLTVSQRYVEPPPAVVRRLERERARLREIYDSRAPLADRGVSFARPVEGDPTSVFGTRRLYNGEPRSPHPGLDLRAAEGTPVRASGPGRVVLADDLYYSGNTVIVDHGGGLFTLYAHLSSIAVDEGADVAAGDLLGRSGATGRVTGPHLHWGAKIGDEPFDPRALLHPDLFR